MTSFSGCRAYQQVQVGTSEQGKLILMLYGGAIANLKKATEMLEQGNIIRRSEYLLKAQQLILELLVSLNLEAGEIAKQLQALYLFMYRHLNEANFSGRRKPIDEVISMLSILQDGWEQIILKRKEEVAPAGERITNAQPAALPM